MGTVYLITGTDTAAIEQTADKVAKQLAGENADEWSLEVHRESEEMPPASVIESLIGSIATPSLFGGSKTLWLKNFAPLANEGGVTALKQKDPLTVAFARLAEQIAEGLPADVNLLMSGPGVDARKKLFQACKKGGKTVVCHKPELNKGRWRDDMARIIQHQASDRGIRLPAGSVEYLTEVLGVDTARVDKEMEKIFCYAGNEPTLEQVQELCVGNREAVFYALTTAIGERNLDLAFRTLAQLMDNARESDSAVIGQIRLLANFFRDLLHARLLMSHLRVSSAGFVSAVERLSAADRERFRHNSCVGKSPFMLRRLGAQAAKYQGRELVRAISLLAQADRLMVSASLPRRTVLESLLLQIIGGNRVPKSRA